MGPSAPSSVHAEIQEVTHSLGSPSTAAGGRLPSGPRRLLWARLVTPPRSLEGRLGVIVGS